MDFIGVFRQLLERTAEALQVPLPRLTAHQPVIEDILKYFETGEIGQPVENDRRPFPRFVRPRLIAVGESLLAVHTVQRGPHSLWPAVEEAFVTFTAADGEQEVPAWREIGPEEKLWSHGNLAFTFTSALSVHENLSDFAVFVLSPAPDTRGNADAPTLERWMIQRHERLSGH